MGVFGLRAVALAVVFVAGLLTMLFAVRPFHPFNHWLLWRYLGYWALAAIWAASCLGAGLRVFDKLFAEPGTAARAEMSDPTTTYGERFVFGFAIGVYAFAAVMATLGFLKLWSPWTFAVVPIVFVLFGRGELLETIGAFHAWFRRSSVGGSWLTWGALAIGAIGLLLLYVPIISPSNIGYDPRWYHMAVSEQYAIRGGIEPFVEGWFSGNNPQLASMIYGWAFLLPFGGLFDHLELSMHLEFAIFVATLASVPALATKLSDQPQPFAWAFMLLFPGLYLYDSNLIGGADHVAAFWAIPIALASYRAWHDYTPRSFALVTIVGAGALLTKYTAVALVLGPGLLLIGRGVYLLVRQPAAQRRHKTLAAVGTGLFSALLLTTPHWLKSLIFYGDPLFPFLHSVFDSSRWVPDLAARLDHAIPDNWKAPHNMDGVVGMLLAPFTFAFRPHNWDMFHGGVPVFGFLYTLTMPAVLFVERRARLLAMYLVISVGIMFWFWTFHQDRYLQAFLPWMAACVAAVVSQAWRSGRLVQITVCALIAAQILWGAGIPFLPTHAMARTSPFETSVDLAGSWWKKGKKRPEIDSPIPPYSDIARKIPENAKVLLHDDHRKLGLGRPFISDALAWQSGIDYAAHAKPSQMSSLMKSFGVTHVVWRKAGGSGLESISGDVAFFYFALNHLKQRRIVRPFNIGAMPDEAITDDGFFGRTAVAGCEKPFDNGIYETSSLTANWLHGRPSKASLPRPVQPLKSNAKVGETRKALSTVDALRYERKCFRLKTTPENLGFVRAHERAGVELYVRKLERRRAPKPHVQTPGVRP